VNVRKTDGLHVQSWEDAGPENKSLRTLSANSLRILPANCLRSLDGQLQAICIDANLYTLIGEG